MIIPIYLLEYQKIPSCRSSVWEKFGWGEVRFEEKFGLGRSSVWGEVRCARKNDASADQDYNRREWKKYSSLQSIDIFL